MDKDNETTLWPQSAQQRIKRIYEFYSLCKTNKELAVTNKFVNSINSLLPRLSETWPQSAQQRIKRIYEL